MNIDAIQNGIVIDHIPAGRGMKLYELLGLEKLNCSVAISKNVHSAKLGKKDFIKIGLREFLALSHLVSSFHCLVQVATKPA